ncbi:MAG: hypothetical protein WAM79_18570 [Candidatus Sulfotelmatobacter sp.]
MEKASYVLELLFHETHNDGCLLSRGVGGVPACAEGELGVISAYKRLLIEEEKDANTANLDYAREWTPRTTT